MTATNAQVRIMMRERQKGKSQEQAAARANVRSRKTVAKYERLQRLPSELKQRRAYRTRNDPFAEDWPQVESMLAATPELEAKALFGWLCEQYPDRYQEGQMRTFQRRVSEWRALHQPQVATLEQVHRPGEVMQMDGVWLTELAVTIQGQPLAHLFIHCVLPYSNWEWGCLAQSESLMALRLALHTTLAKLGYVPQYHQTDNSSAATRRVQAVEKTEAGRERTYTEGYLHLLAHYGLEARVTHRQSPQEDGDVESSHGGLKRALLQHLLLRSSRDFESLESYRAFVEQVLEKRNRLRLERLADETQVMRPLTVAPLVAAHFLWLRVSKGSLIKVDHNHYSVPTSLIGRMVSVHVSEWQLEVCYGRKLVVTLPRLVGQEHQHVNYRHVIDSLLRKPGGFRDYRYREALFPSLVFRQAWERLNTWYAPRQADLSYLRILRLAAQTLESQVATALQSLLERPAHFNDSDVAALLNLQTPAAPAIECGEVSLAQYDRLLPSHQAGEEPGHVAQ
jgi:transcriptional regulator with XRE-family HTH domain